MENIIKVDNLIFEYTSDEPTYRAIDDFNLDIKKGEFVAIIGHNGSGKSTLSKNLNAILVPTSGDINIKGMNTRDEKYLWDIRQTAGMVFQNPDNQFVGATVEDDVAFGLENQGIPREEMLQRVEKAIEQVGMLEFKDREPSRLSGGQKQRVALARALAMKPDVLLLDEPTSALDPELVGEVEKSIADAAKSGQTMILVSHDMNFVYQVADKVLFLEKGRILEQGTPDEVFNHPKEERTKEFFASYSKQYL